VVGSVSNIAQHVVERAVKSTSRGAHISPSSIKRTMGQYIPYTEGVKLHAPQSTVSPLCHVRIAVDNIFRLEGITSLREKEAILRRVDTEFQTINTSMGVEAMLPHQNLPMYMNTLKLYMKERADNALHDYVHVKQELPQMYGQEHLPVKREITPVKDANIEIE